MKPKSSFLFLIKEIMAGKSVTRAYLNLLLSQEILKGRTIDIGGGENSNYIDFMKFEENFSFGTLDIKSDDKLDFEKDQLPANDNEYDTVLFLNVMEHIYNYKHIMKEVIRITKPSGRVIGFVPFMMWYHPDHGDYFRFTHEALEKIIQECGSNKFSIKPVAKGPFTAAFQMICKILPKLIRIPTIIIFHALDVVYLHLQPNNGDRYALGYYFIITPSDSDIP